MQKGMRLRHPSPNSTRHLVREFCFFLCCGSCGSAPGTSGVLFSSYMIGYGAIRFVIEYFREPDAHLGFIFFSFSMGPTVCAVP